TTTSSCAIAAPKPSPPTPPSPSNSRPAPPSPPTTGSRSTPPTPSTPTSATPNSAKSCSLPTAPPAASSASPSPGNRERQRPNTYYPYIILAQSPPSSLHVGSPHLHLKVLPSRPRLPFPPR